MSRETLRDDLRHLLILLPVAGILFGIGILRYDIWPPDEPRFAQVAREMYQTGDYLRLTVNGEPYTEKPPLLFWCMAAFAHLFGDVTEPAARIPSIIAGVMGIGFTYLLGARMFGARTGLWAALILMTSFRFWWQARTGQTDMLLAGCVAGSMYCLWRWDSLRRASWLVAAYAFLAAALLTKGPPALVFVLFGTWFFYRGEPFSRKNTHWLLGSCAAIFIVLLWYLPARLLTEDAAASAVQTGVGENLFRNTIGRLFLGISKVQPPWYYLTTIPVDLMPWTLFLPWVLAKAWRERKQDRAMHFLMAWTVPALIFFSISTGKRATYLLPLFPIFAVLTARGVLAFMDGENAVWRKRLSNVWGGGVLLLGMLTAVTPWITVQGMRLPAEFHLRVHLFSALLVFCAAYTFLRQKYVCRSPLHRVICGQMAMILVATAGAIFPVVNVFQSARDFCGPLRYLAEHGEEYRLYSVGFTREAYIYYAKHFHKPVLTEMIGADGLSGSELYAAGKLQKDTRERIQDAVDEVPIADLDEISPAELAALRAAIEAAIDGMGSEAEAAKRFESQLRAVLDGFAATVGEDHPAYFFVKDDDWRWILPLQGAPPKYHVVRHQRVGSREVLLIANPAGKQLLDRKLKGAALS